MNSKMNSGQKGIAIIGSGLAGLTAAYFIQKWSKFPITILESCERVGGRVHRSTDLPGEHGARYLLKSELDVRPGDDYWRDYGLPDGKNIKQLFDDLEIRPAIIKDRDWPQCCVLETKTFVQLDPTGKKLEPHFPAAARVISKLQEKSPSAQGKFSEWIQHNVRRDEGSRKILKMLLAGETCAPWTHLLAQYARECLKSAVDSEETWYTVEGGSGKLIKKLSRSSAGRIQRGSTCLKVRKAGRNAVEVTYKNKTGIKKTKFQGVIISSPDGHKLVGQSSESRHFHSYISILFKFKSRPRRTKRPEVDFRDGLYTDHPLMNYLEAEDIGEGKPRWVLRILTPEAERFRRWSDEEIIGKCLKVLENKLQIKVKPFGAPSIKRWEQGLPCGGTSQKYEKVSEGIYLCGDRFGRWPSMAAAIVSGARAADAILNDLA